MQTFESTRPIFFRSETPAYHSTSSMYPPIYQNTSSPYTGGPSDAHPVYNTFVHHTTPVSVDNNDFLQYNWQEGRYSWQTTVTSDHVDKYICFDTSPETWTGCQLPNSVSDFTAEPVRFLQSDDLKCDTTGGRLCEQKEMVYEEAGYSTSDWWLTPSPDLNDPSQAFAPEDYTANPTNDYTLLDDVDETSFDLPENSFSMISDLESNIKWLLNQLLYSTAQLNILEQRTYEMELELAALRAEGRNNIALTNCVG